MEWNLQVTNSGHAWDTVLEKKKIFLAAGSVACFWYTKELVAIYKPAFMSFSNPSGCACHVSILMDSDRSKVHEVTRNDDF